MRPLVGDIVTLASRMSGISEKVIKSKSRKRAVVRVRQAVHFIAREHRYSFPIIARGTGRSDHTTVIHSCKSVPVYIQYESDFASFVERLSDAAKITGPLEGRLTPIDGTPPDLRPEGDEQEDRSHQFHKRIAKGSDALAAALAREMAA